MDTIATRPEVNGGVKIQRRPFTARLPAQLHFPVKIRMTISAAFAGAHGLVSFAKCNLADPLTCPKCGGSLRVISFIDNPSVIEKILNHLKLWDPPERPPPPQPSTTMEPEDDFLAWEAAGRMFDAID